MEKLEKEFKIIDDRLFGYYFNEGDEVMFDPELIGYYVKSLKFDKTLFIPFLDMKGIVESCTSDIHSFGAGSSYMCTVRFGECFLNCFKYTTLAGCFIPYNSSKTNECPLPKTND